MKYRGCVPALIDLLKEHDAFWAKQDLEPGWWNRSVESPLTQQRRNIYGEVYDAVLALGTIGDPQAVASIEMTRRRWAAIPIENRQIVEACDQALKILAQQPPPSTP